jgi:hypothetical protein
VRRCTFRSGTQVRVQGRQFGANLGLSGHQDWHFGPPDANGVRPIFIPASGTHFDPATLPFGLGTLCARPNGDSSGVVDCDGGLASYSNTVQQDHNTNSANGGFGPDPECDDTFTQPDGSVSSANLEAAGDPHPNVCNSPVRIVESGSFVPGGIKLTENIIIRLITSGSCPPDNAPYDEGAGDIAVTGSGTTGVSAGTVFNHNNGSGPLQQSGSGCGLFGNEACTCNVTGLPFTCANIDADNLSTGRIGAAFPALDLPTINDAVATLTVLCQ